ncbi:MAG: isocitrate lyase/phosphoenolpyruvate mutase family protein [Verrucomicrobiota bacterium]|jgi:phosphoenolpyruvate phosphomutase
MLADPQKLIRVLGAHDAVGARLIREAGFDGVWASSLEISCAMGVPDDGVLTMAEIARASKAMAQSVDIPVVADCDCGFGDARKVTQMVKTFEAAGVAAVCIEDAAFPKRNSLVPGEHRLAAIPEFVEKIHAAKRTQRDPDFVVIARIEALIAGASQEEALRRARAYATAGADAILIHSRSSSPDEIMAFIAAWDSAAPLVLVPTTYYSISQRQLRQSGKVKMVIYANHGIRAAIAAMRRVLRQIREDEGAQQAEQWICPIPELLRLNGVLEPEGVTLMRSGIPKSKEESTLAAAQSNTRP